MISMSDWKTSRQNCLLLFDATKKQNLSSSQDASIASPCPMLLLRNTAEMIAWCQPVVVDCHKQWSPVVTPAFQPTVWGSGTKWQWARTWPSCASRATWWSERTEPWAGPALSTALGVAPCHLAKVSADACMRSPDAHMPQCTVNLDHRQSGAVTTLTQSHTIKSTCVYTLEI